MKRFAIVLGALGACQLFVLGCGNGSSVNTNATDSGGPDSTAEGGAPDGASDATLDSGADTSTADGGDAATASDASEAGGPTCTAVDAGGLDDASVSAGLAFILTTGHCTHCHQSDPDAGVILSGNSNSITDAGPVFPPNLTPDPLTGLGCWTNDQIASAILFGIDPATDGGKLCRLMPEFGVPKGDAAPSLDDASVGNVVEALRSLAAVSNSVPMTMCPALSTGGSAEAGTLEAGDDAASE